MKNPPAFPQTGKTSQDARKRKTIPWLALSMLHFNAPATNKAGMARIRALLADRLIAQSYRIRERL